jgi:hypothetical protein
MMRAQPTDDGSGCLADGLSSSASLRNLLYNERNEIIFNTSPKYRAANGRKLTLMHLLSLSSISFCDLLYLICKLGFLSIQRQFSTDRSRPQRQLTTALMAEEVFYLRRFFLAHTDTCPMVPDIARVTCTKTDTSRQVQTMQSNPAIHHKRRTVA